jgi:hypothetical protein
MVKVMIRQVNLEYLVVGDLMVVELVVEILEVIHHQKEILVLEPLEMIMVVLEAVVMAAEQVEKMADLELLIASRDHL